MGISPALKQLMAQKANKYKSGGDNAKKLKEGRTVLRIIAPKPSEASWVKEEMEIFRDVGVHWIKPSENAKPLAVVGNSEICYGQVSAVSAAVDMAIANAYDEDSKKLYESWKARTSVVVNAIDRSDGTADIWELPKGVWGKIMDLWSLYAEQDFDIFDHVSGLDLVVTRTGTGLNTKYDVQASPIVPGKAFTPVAPEMVANSKDLDAFISANYFRGEEQKALSVISQIASVAIPQLGAPATPTAALTSSASVVSGATAMPSAPVADPAALAAQQAALAAQQAALMAQMQPAPQPAPQPAAQPMQIDAAQQAALMAALAAQQAATTAPVAEILPPQPAPAPIAASTSMSDLTQEQQDDILRQLANI